MAAGIRIKSGDPLQLGYLFEDGNASLYVRAHVYNSSDVEVSGSPFNLAHIANGYFTNTAYSPSDGYYKAVYIPYEDAGYTIQASYSQEEDVYSVLSTDVDEEAIAQAVWNAPDICTNNNIADSAGWLLCNIHAIVADTNNKINTYLLPLLALLQQVNDRVEAGEIAKAVWNAARAVHQVTGSFGEALQGVLSVSRATLLDNLSRLDVVVSTRADQITVDQIYINTDQLESRLTAARADNLDLLDIAVSSRSSQASVDGKPNLSQIADGVWDENLAGHLTAGSTGKALSDASVLSIDYAAIADAVWDELKSGHNIAGSFGSLLDVAVSSRCASTDCASVLSSLNALHLKVDTLPTACGDATLTMQNSILSAIGTKASQTSLDSAIAGINAIPTNPLLANDSRIDRLDADVSTRLSTSDFNVIKGAGFNASTDTLEAIRDAIGAPVDLSPVLNDLSDIKGAGFNTGTDSLKEIRIQVDSTKASADNAAANALDAYNATASRSSQASVDAIATDVSAIPTNPLLDNDSRINRLDADISTRATQVSVDEIKGSGFNASTDTLEAIRNAIDASNCCSLVLANQADILNKLAGTALESTLIGIITDIAAIPTNPLLDNDARLDHLDADISSRLSTPDFNIIKGGGFDQSTDTLESISDKLNDMCIASDLNAILSELDLIKGTGFQTIADSLKALNDKAIADRNVLKADLTALMSTGEGF